MHTFTTVGRPLQLFVYAAQQDGVTDTIHLVRTAHLGPERNVRSHRVDPAIGP